jgi:diguanylate cyclase (GGDEF)-like protein
MTSTSTLSRLPDTSGSTTHEPSVDERSLVEEARARRRSGLTNAEAGAALVTSGSFLAAAIAFALVAHANRPFHLGAAALLVTGFALLSQLELEIGSGSTVPTQLVFVPMLFALPLPVVPLCVCFGYLLGGGFDALRGHARLARAVALPGCSWFSLPPALVLLATGAGGQVRWQSAPVYLGALVAQAAGDLAHTAVHEGIAHRVAPRRLLVPLTSVYLFDALLSPVALLAAISAGAEALSVLALIPLAGVFGALARERRARHDSELRAARLDVLARTDPLTGLANRRALDEAMIAVLAAARAQATSVALCLLDLDEFKAYNDSHGHPAGDSLLQQIAASWSLHIRPGDVLARVGGEEFALLLPDCTLADGQAIVGRLLGGTPRPTTCSAGLATWDGVETAAALKQRADAALYRAKRAGRDRLELAA